MHPYPHHDPTRRRPHIALLVVAEVLHGRMGEEGAGFPQSPQFEPGAWFSKLVPWTDLHIGAVMAVIAVVAAHWLLWASARGGAAVEQDHGRATSTIAALRCQHAVGLRPAEIQRNAAPHAAMLKLGRGTAAYHGSNGTSDEPGSPLV